MHYDECKQFQKYNGKQITKYVNLDFSNLICRGNRMYEDYCFVHLCFLWVIKHNVRRYHLIIYNKIIVENLRIQHIFATFSNF